MALLGKQQRRDHLICYLTPSSDFSRLHRSTRDVSCGRIRRMASVLTSRLHLSPFTHTQFASSRSHGSSSWIMLEVSARPSPRLRSPHARAPLWALTTARLGSRAPSRASCTPPDVTCNPIIERPRAFLFALGSVFRSQHADPPPVEYTVCIPQTFLPRRTHAPSQKLSS